MDSAKNLSNPINIEELVTLIRSPKPQSRPKKVQPRSLDPVPLDIDKLEAEQDQPTLGQRVADAMATKVGSWSFLIGQTIVLTGWVGANLIPGVPHWDQSPFILLNLVFSFASAYTAPVVLMSQNRQSDEERKKAEYDHLVNRKASYDIELLHKKIDIIQSQYLQELTEIIKQQQQQINEMKGIVEPVLKAQQQPLTATQESETAANILPTLNQQFCQGLEAVNSNLLDTNYSACIPFNYNQSIENARKTITIINASLNDSELF